MGAMLQFCCDSVRTTLAMLSSGLTYTSDFGSRPNNDTSSRNPLQCVLACS